MSEVAQLPVATPTRREAMVVMDSVPVLDTARFEHMQRIAVAMARSPLVPDTLRGEYSGQGQSRVLALYEPDQITANCFLVVNQAVRWGMDPFAVAQCVSVVHGKLCYEGKLVAAVLDAKLGVKLHHVFTGKPASDDLRIFLSDRPFTPELIEVLTAGLRLPGVRLFDGSVAEWKTTGSGTPWTPKNFTRMLLYRGTRDWARAYEPAAMLGVYTDDEMMDLAENARAERARPAIPLADRLTAGKAPGFSAVAVDQQTAAAPIAASEMDHDPDTGEVADPAPASTQPSPQPAPAQPSARGAAAAPSSAPVEAPAAPAGSTSPSASTPLPMMTDREFVEHVAKTLAATTTPDSHKAVLAGFEPEIKTRPEPVKFVCRGIASAHRRRVTAEITSDQATTEVAKLLERLAATEVRS